MPYRLLRAAELGLVPTLSRYGFTATGHDDGLRGESATCSNGHVVIRLLVDWLERCMHVTLQLPGQREVPLEDLVDLSGVKALHLSNIQRRATAETLASTLRKIALALDEQVPELLRGDVGPSTGPEPPAS